MANRTEEEIFKLIELWSEDSLAPSSAEGAWRELGADRSSGCTNKNKV